MSFISLPFKIDDFSIYDSVSNIDETIVSIFFWSDLKYVEENSKIKEIFFQCSAKVLRERLEILGFSMNIMKRIFKYSTERRIEEFDGHFHAEKFVLESAFDESMSALNLIIRDKLNSDNFSAIYSDKSSRILKYLLEHEDSLHIKFPLFDDFWDNIYDIRNFVRCSLDVVPDSAIVKYDLTNFFLENYERLSEDDLDFIHSIIYSSKILIHQPEEKILILCEGISDKKYIKRSMKLLYPEYSDIYEYIDFENSKPDRGASEIVKLVKAFISVNVRMKIIAVLDNDTAAEKELLKLDGIQIPYNIKILKYPQLAIAEKYPTVGPNGYIDMDINGMACSIEVYLGNEIISNNGKYYPIQWQNYDTTTKQFHGAITNKKNIGDTFEKKLKDCEKDYSKIENYDWDGMKLICRSIFNAFKYD